ncbi:MAG: D-alanyl-D-alanine carboxypeptidase family protein, partial [Cyanobacteria bacterium P01_F01_bin.86]
GRGKLHTTITVGTSGYMPIEQKRGKPCLSSDLYALGMVAIEALTGILAKDLAIAPDTLEPQWQGQVMVAASLAEFIDRLTQWQASYRPHSAQDALRQLPVSVPQSEDASGHCGPAFTAIANHSRNNANRATAIKEETLIQNTLYVENSKGTQAGHNLTAIRSGLALGPRFLTPILARISGPPSPSQTIEAMAHVQENLTDVVSPAAQELTTLPAVVEPRKLPVKPIAMGVGVLLSCLVIWGLGIKIAERWERWERPQITIGFNQLRYPEVAAQELVCIYKDCEIEGRLRPAAFNAFWQMWSAARQEGIQLYPIGSFQSVEGQRDALAGLPKSQIRRQIHFSDYHTGYGLALGDAQVPEANWQMTFETTAAYQWLQANAADFGFELSYPAGNAAGMEPEPWHWRYVGDSDSQAMFGTN